MSISKKYWPWAKSIEALKKAWSLTDTKVKPKDLDACHRMKKEDKVIIKFKNRKQINEVIFERKELKCKVEDLFALEKDSICFKN